MLREPVVHRPRLDPLVVARCCDAVRAGESFAQVARREQVSTSTVQMWCQRRGIRSAHPAGRPPRVPRPERIVRVPKPKRAPKPETDFDITLRACEAEWGPFRTWSREHHRVHTAMLCRAAGIDEARA